MRVTTILAVSVGVCVPSSSVVIAATLRRLRKDSLQETTFRRLRKGNLQETTNSASHFSAPRPVWLETMEAKFGDLSHCPRIPPSSRIPTECAGRPPCFYDHQSCFGGTTYPEVRCDCLNDKWDCDMFECPVVLAED